jgi:hypothetical protein
MDIIHEPTVKHCAFLGPRVKRRFDSSIPKAFMRGCVSRSEKFVFSILGLFIVTYLFGAFASAAPEAPLNEAEAQAWIGKSPSDPDFPFALLEVKTAVTSNYRVAKNKLGRYPESPAVQSEMGSALHALGHVAEIENDFLLAADYHRESVKYYRMSGGVRASGSWDDGVNHALEHVFMDIYDHGRWLEAQGRVKEARDRFRDAWKYAVSEELSEQYDVGRDARFTARMQSLRARSDFGLITQSAGDRVLGAIGRLFGRAPRVVQVTCESMFFATPNTASKM